MTFGFSIISCLILDYHVKQRHAYMNMIFTQVKLREGRINLLCGSAHKYSCTNANMNIVKSADYTNSITTDEQRRRPFWFWNMTRHRHRTVKTTIISKAVVIYTNRLKKWMWRHVIITAKFSVPGHESYTVLNTSLFVFLNCYWEMFVFFLSLAEN